jgi:MinD superfamily P-loop ATPase
MKIAVLSGKGGTGKTLAAVNLAAVAASALYLDCDVEEPNGHLFFKPQEVISEPVTVKVPVVDEKLCNGCRECVEFCRYNALAYIMNHLLIYEEICHSCGGCVLVCPEKALSERDREIGPIARGKSERVVIHTGILNPGEASGVPIIKELMRGSELISANLLNTDPNITEHIIIDCPPGSSCIVMESIKDADFCLLVAEPTIFGLHNLKMVYELVKLFAKPFAVLVNKGSEGATLIADYCEDEGIAIIGEIPFDREIGRINSNGEILAHHSKQYNDLFRQILAKIVEVAECETTTGP